MERENAQLKQLYAELKLIYLEMLTLTRDLQCLCVGNTFLAESDREKLAELLSRREKLMEEAAARQKEAGVLEQKLRGGALNTMQGNTPPPPAGGIPEGIPGGIPPWRGQPGARPRRLDALVEEIIALDTVTSQALNRSLQEAAGKIKKIQMARKANKAYQDQAYQPEGFFVDSNK